MSEQPAVSSRRKFYRSLILLLLIAGSLAVSSIAVNPAEHDFSAFRRVITFFLGMLVQSFPFLLAGTIVSSTLHFFVPEHALQRLLGRSSFTAIPAAIVASMAFPVCDCASVPVASRLMRKGVPISAAITYMLASPILNPVVIASTFFAFPDRPGLCAGRIVLGLLIPVSIGLMLGKFFTRESATRLMFSPAHSEECGCGCHGHRDEKKETYAGKIAAMLVHAGDEFVAVSPYIIAGAAVSSLVQVAVPREALALTSVSSRFLVHPLIMICAAFLLSVCSTSDAFIARGFSSAFSGGSVLAFMTAGPMIDVKNILMMLPYFRKRFIAVLAFLVCLMSYLSAGAASFLFFGVN